MSLSALKGDVELVLTTLLALTVGLDLKLGRLCQVSLSLTLSELTRAECEIIPDDFARSATRLCNNWGLFYFTAFTSARLEARKDLSESDISTVFKGETNRGIKILLTHCIFRANQIERTNSECYGFLSS